MSELHDLTALEQAAAVRSRQVSPVELVRHYLERIELLNSTVGAFVALTPERAKAQAAQCEKAVLSGVDLPPLAGVPTAIKDLNFVAGVPLGMGSRAYEGFVSPVDDHVVVLLRRAGTISLGKTSVPEFGLPCYTESDVAPPARTPWDLTRSAGGSSGGAAAAVSAGLVPFAQGSDGGGSLRIPASVCGLVGIKVSRGRISNGPLLGDMGSGLAWNGPLARTVGDAAAMLDVMAVPMPGDPYVAPAPPHPFSEAVGMIPERLRVGLVDTPVVGGSQVHPECLAAVEVVAGVLQELGHEVERATMPFGPELTPMFETVWAASAASIPVDPSREVLLRPLTRWLRDRGRATSAPALLNAIGALQLAGRRVAEALGGYDILLSPTLAELPAPVGWFDSAPPADDFERQKAFTPFTAVFNMTGQPAVSLPLHWTADSLPVGVMLAGRYGDEVTLISAAAQLQEAIGWSRRKPPVW